ncbi:MAG TPA: hypothetical protein VFA33_05180 [Bryobacteraceae bacterium]|nr:hypothetical protein [Bryobacteraceae bacterium]
MAFYRRPNWAQLTKDGVPPLYVLRPLSGGWTPPNVGDEYPAPDPANKFQMMRARQMYEQRRVGPWPDLEIALLKSGRQQPPQHAKPAAPHRAGKEKKDGSRNPQNRN